MSPVYTGSSDEGAGGGGLEGSKGPDVQYLPISVAHTLLPGPVSTNVKTPNVGLASDANNRLLQASSSTSLDAPLSTYAQVVHWSHPT